MNVKHINIYSVADCQELMERIQQTLLANQYTMSRISTTPKSLPGNDNEILEQLSEAILTIQAVWASVVRILPNLRVSLSNYNISSVARLTDDTILGIAALYKKKIQSRFFEKELLAIRDNAKAFQKIIDNIHKPLRSFIKSYLPAAAYDPSCNCYIRPVDDQLLKHFTHPSSKFKLHLVGLGICCEFFKNIGIDEFKPDVHATRFMNRININRSNVRVSGKPEDVREIGIKMADTLKVPRASVDGHVWVFCAEDEGEICTGDDPKCELCQLRIKEPILCKGFPSKSEIVKNPVAAANRFRECNLTWKEAHKYMNKAGLAPDHIREIITRIY